MKPIEEQANKVVEALLGKPELFRWVYQKMFDKGQNVVLWPPEAVLYLKTGVFWHFWTLTGQQAARIKKAPDDNKYYCMLYKDGRSHIGEGVETLEEAWAWVEEHLSKYGYRVIQT